MLYVFSEFFPELIPDIIRNKIPDIAAMFCNFLDHGRVQINVLYGRHEKDAFDIEGSKLVARGMCEGIPADIQSALKGVR